MKDLSLWILCSDIVCLKRLVNVVLWGARNKQHNFQTI